MYPTEQAATSFAGHGTDGCFTARSSVRACCMMNWSRSFHFADLGWNEDWPCSNASRGIRVPFHLCLKRLRFNQRNLRSQLQIDQHHQAAVNLEEKRRFLSGENLAKDRDVFEP